MTTPAHTHTAMSPPPDNPQPPGPDEAAAPDPGPPADPALVADPSAAPDPVAAVESAADAPATPWTVKALLAALTAAVTVVGGALTALLVYEFSSIDDRFAAIDARFAAIDARFANLETDIDTRFDSLEAGQAEIARTLAVLIAELNARAEVDAALAGQLLTPYATVPVDSAAPSP